MIGAIVTVNRTKARTQRTTATWVPDEFPRDVPGLHAPDSRKRDVSGHGHHDFVASGHPVGEYIGQFGYRQLGGENTTVQGPSSRLAAA